MDYFVHESSYVDEPCENGAGTKIWHFSLIMKNCRIGAHCNLGQNVCGSPNVVIGNNCKIQNNVSLYTGLILEDDVFCGPSCVCTNVNNPRSEIVRHHLYERTLVRHGASIGANATIVCGTTIGRFAFIAAGAVVSRDVPDYTPDDRRSGAPPGLDQPPRTYVEGRERGICLPEKQVALQRNGTGGFGLPRLGRRYPAAEFGSCSRRI